MVTFIHIKANLFSIMKLRSYLPSGKPVYLFIFIAIIISCSDSDSIIENETGCTKTCPTAFVLNSDNCECEPEPCTKTCVAGFTLNTTSCECECTKSCDTGFRLNEATCECEENFMAKVVVVETETATLSGSWKKKTTIADHTGDGYIVWEGPDQFWKGLENIGNTGRLTYKINIPRAGTYAVQWRSYIAKVDPAGPNTEHNDSWLRLPDADDFYAEKGNGSILYPKGSGKTPNPAGENGNGFFKVYMNTGGAWTWTSGTSDRDFHAIYARFDEAKEYTVEIAARSSYHAIDKFKLTEQKPK